MEERGLLVGSLPPPPSPSEHTEKCHVRTQQGRSHLQAEEGGPTSPSPDLRLQTLEH